MNKFSSGAQFNAFIDLAQKLEVSYDDFPRNLLYLLEQDRYGVHPGTIGRVLALNPENDEYKSHVLIWLLKIFQYSDRAEVHLRDHIADYRVQLVSDDLFNSPIEVIDMLPSLHEFKKRIVNERRESRFNGLHP